MSTSPLINPGNPRRRRPARWRGMMPSLLVGLLVLATLAALGAVFGIIGEGLHGHRSARSARHEHPRAPVVSGLAAVGSSALAPPASAVASAPALSPTGLALGRPALKLKGVGAPQHDPLQIRFRRPPRAGLLFNLNTGRVLWQRNPLRRARIASLNKMMTALLSVRSAPPDARVLVTKQAVEAAGSKVGVLPRGRHVRLESMLYGLLLPSGNDAAAALAQSIAGSLSAFVARMNSEAAHLGLGCTRYSSPSGYFDEGNFSCAADLAVLAHVDLSQPRIAKIVATRAAALPFPIKGRKLYLYNNNPLLIAGYPGLTGLKTGYTVASGRCLVATATRHRVRLGVVLLHSPAPANQARQLLDLGFQRIYHQAPVPEAALGPDA